MAELLENARKDGSRTKHSITSRAQMQGCSHAILPAISPSKRNVGTGNNKTEDTSATLGLSLRNRKDTPAPPPLGPAVRPAPRLDWRAIRPLPGGDRALEAVAADITSSTRYNEDGWPQHDKLQARRRGIGSFSSAVDTRADRRSVPQWNAYVNGIEHAEARTSARDFVTVLPTEICLQIFEYLDADDLLLAQTMTSTWCALSNKTSVWRTAYLRKYNRKDTTVPAPVEVGGMGIGRLNEPIQEWKRMYRARVSLDQNWRKGAEEAGKAIYLSGHTDSVYCLQFDEEKIITGSRDRTIRVWDINTFQCLRVIGGPKSRPTFEIRTLRTVGSPSFHLATASVNGTAYGESIFHVPSDWHDASILCLQYDDKILVTGSTDSDLLIWDINTYEPIKRLQSHTNGVLDVALDANYIVSCAKDSRIIVWDRETLEPKGDLIGHLGPVNAVRLRGQYLVSASIDGVARLWDVTSMKLLKEFTAKVRGLAAVDFSEDRKYVVAGGDDRVTYKFEVATGREVQQFIGHSQLVRSLWLDSANSRIVSGSYDLDLRVYDFITGQEIWRAEHWTTSWILAAKSDYRRIVAASQDGRILVVDFGLVKGGRKDGEILADVQLLCANLGSV